MLLYFHHKLDALRLTALEFFETAYMARFNKQGHITPDYCEYVLHGVLPIYVMDYLKTLQQKEEAKPIQVCIGNCKVCQYCDGS